MEKKMSLMGVGAKIAVVLIVSVIVTLGISLLSAPAFRIIADYSRLVVPAVILAAVGFSLNLIAAFGMLSAYRKGQLATGGLYSICLNPMYTFQIFLTVPGLLLLLNSWLVMLTVVPVFIAFKVYAKEEERYLEKKFGILYTDYRQKVLLKFL